MLDRDSRFCIVGVLVMDCMSIAGGRSNYNLWGLTEWLEDEEKGVE